MSTFRVKLTNAVQGKLSGASQRSIYAMGPRRINRELKDGDIFEDCNYWKRFAYPQTSLENAFIEVIEDDGVQYIDNETTNFPKVFNIISEPGSNFEENKADILRSSGGFAVFAQITNENTEEGVKIRLNESADAIIDLPAGSTQSFQAGDLSISTIEIKNESESQVRVQILVSISVIPNS
jgi:hypothetical protein